ncbi:OsmC family protein [Pseudothermotoga sp.]|uniref:OsmC family protein n=1 Tax=Pseudothermotoga sp. TaxID=2033661 RepID=UPI00299BA21D|nr:OsmC family protein [Pseudothermotoga sp.]MCX7813685.1 OsmC family protein [Pseudothermotoga sp.]MDW8139468.1 OsmC family protein [Pseudothermotoga sp.]
MDVKFSVSAKSETPSRVVVKARNFTMYVDEPPQLGGDDKGANPVEYLLAALAGCINVVGHLVAKEMNIRLDELSIDIEGTLNPARLQGRSFQERAGYKQINVNIKVKSNASEDLLTKWLKSVEDRCPVSDNIENPTPLKFHLSRI